MLSLLKKKCVSKETLNIKIKKMRFKKDTLFLISSLFFSLIINAQGQILDVKKIILK